MVENKQSSVTDPDTDVRKSRRLTIKAVDPSERTQCKPNNKHCSCYRSVRRRLCYQCCCCSCCCWCLLLVLLILLMLLSLMCKLPMLQLLALPLIALDVASALPSALCVDVALSLACALHWWFCSQRCQIQKTDYKRMIVTAPKTTVSCRSVVYGPPINNLTTKAKSIAAFALKRKTGPNN